MFGPFFPERQVSRRGKTHVSYAYIFSYIKRVSFVETCKPYEIFSRNLHCTHIYEFSYISRDFMIFSIHLDINSYIFSYE